MKSLCVLNKSTGSAPEALASVGLGLDNQDCRIKTRGRNTRVILLARIPSALLACLPQSGGGESKSRAERERNGGRADQSSTGNNNVEAELGSSVCRSALLCSVQHAVLCLPMHIQKPKIYACAPISSANVYTESKVKTVFVGSPTKNKHFYSIKLSVY